MKKEPKKFPYVANLDELKAVSESGAAAFISEESASKTLGVPKSTLKLLEARGDITGYRLKGGNPDKDLVFIDAQSVKDYQVRKAEAGRVSAAKALAKEAAAEAAAAEAAAAKEPVGAAS